MKKNQNFYTGVNNSVISLKITVSYNLVQLTAKIVGSQPNHDQLVGQFTLLQLLAGINSSKIDVKLINQNNSNQAK